MKDDSGAELSGRRRAIADELRRLEESAMYSAQIQFEAAKQWRGMNLVLGLPASVLAAVAGATALADATNQLVAGILALMSAAFGAILTTVNAAHRMNQASAAANAYLEIQTAARQARLIDLPGQDIDEIRATLAELTARRDEQNKTVEPPNRRAYKRGSKNIEDGGQSYEVDSPSESDRNE
ncbi:SLATT domain-containing protein [Pseudonocardia sp. DR1-2]|uniref:SLATT domain-containing protein n=1 Tax=Pseudonocardia sp. DR1-2 TaxID=2951168 RepID=UPI002043692F|nr:SLATT domain-containing protein [Pseudonocardia sp. DR1-2]MCM3848778.1 SLATT domain-containing protein [Pseudonocardia sp. DR1-2]